MTACASAGSASGPCSEARCPLCSCAACWATRCSRPLSRRLSPSGLSRPRRGRERPLSAPRPRRHPVGRPSPLPHSAACSRRTPRVPRGARYGDLPQVRAAPPCRGRAPGRASAHVKPHQPRRPKHRRQRPTSRWQTVVTCPDQHPSTCNNVATGFHGGQPRNEPSSTDTDRQTITHDHPWPTHPRHRLPSLASAPPLPTLSHRTTGDGRSCIRGRPLRRRSKSTSKPGRRPAQRPAPVRLPSCPSWPTHLWGK